MNAEEQVQANIALMDERAGALAALLNRLAWPEVHGPYHQRPQFPHVVQGSAYRIAINYSTVMMYHRETMVHRFIDIPQDKDLDVIVWLATEFHGWVTQREGS